MRVPSIDRLAPWLSGIGLFLAGMIIGSAVYMAIHQHNYSLLIEKNLELQSENTQLKKDNQVLDKYKASQTLIRKVSVVLDSRGQPILDSITSIEIKKKVQMDLGTAYLGQQIADFTDPRESDQVRLIVQKRYPVNGKDYIVQLKTILILQSELMVVVSVEESIPNPNPTIDFLK